MSWLMVAYRSWTLRLKTRVLQNHNSFITVQIEQVAFVRVLLDVGAKRWNTFLFNNWARGNSNSYYSATFLQLVTLLGAPIERNHWPNIIVEEPFNNTRRSSMNVLAFPSKSHVPAPKQSTGWSTSTSVSAVATKNNLGPSTTNPVIWFVTAKVWHPAPYLPSTSSLVRGSPAKISPQSDGDVGGAGSPSSIFSWSGPEPLGWTLGWTLGRTLGSFPLASACHLSSKALSIFLHSGARTGSAAYKDRVSADKLNLLSSMLQIASLGRATSSACCSGGGLGLYFGKHFPTSPAPRFHSSSKKVETDWIVYWWQINTSENDKTGKEQAKHARSNVPSYAVAWMTTPFAMPSPPADL